MTQTKQLENKIPDTSSLVKKTDNNTKITEIENKISSGLVTNAALTAVENKIPGISSLVKKKKIMPQKLLKLKRNLLMMIMINILLLLSLIIQQQDYF